MTLKSSEHLSLSSWEGGGSCSVGTRRTSLDGSMPMTTWAESALKSLVQVPYPYILHNNFFIYIGIILPYQPTITRRLLPQYSLVFPRDGTSRGTSRDKPGRDIPLSLCPGTQKKFLSWCPVVPGQGHEQMSRDKLFCSGPSRDKTI